MVALTTSAGLAALAFWAGGPPDSPAGDQRPTITLAPPAPEATLSDIPMIDYTEVTADNQADAGTTTQPSAAPIPDDVRVVRAEAAAFVPRSWATIAEITAGPAAVRILRVTRVEAGGSTRHQATAAEAASINGTKPAGSSKPDVREGDWIGHVSAVTTYYEAEVRWLDPARPAEIGELGFVGGPYADIYLVVDGMPLPRVGSEYLLFWTLGDGWATPAYVQFSVQDGRRAPHMHNDRGVGQELLGLPVAVVKALARSYTFRNGVEAREGPVSAE